MSSFKFWQECTDPVDMDALWSDAAVSVEWLAAGEIKGEQVHLSRDPYGQPYLTQTEMTAVAAIVVRRHFHSVVDMEMICAIAELESARQPFATNTPKSSKDMDISYGIMQLSPKTAEWLFRDGGFQDYEIEGDPSFLYKPFMNIYLGAAYLKWLSNFESIKRSEEFVVRAFKGGAKKAAHKSTLPYWKRYLSVKESLPSRDTGDASLRNESSVTDQAYDPATHPSSTQDDSQRYWDSRSSPEDMQDLWSRREIYRVWLNSQQKKGSVRFCHDERKRPYLSEIELLAVAEIIFSKHFSSTKMFSPAALCALAEVVSIRYVDGLGPKTGLMGIDYEKAQMLHSKSGYTAYKMQSETDLKNPFASMYYAAAYLCWLSEYEDRERSPRFIIQAYLCGPENVKPDDTMGSGYCNYNAPGYCKYMAALSDYEAMRRGDNCTIL